VLSYRYWISRLRGRPQHHRKKTGAQRISVTVVGVSQGRIRRNRSDPLPQVRIPIMMKLQTDQLGFYDLRIAANRWVTPTDA